MFCHLDKRLAGMTCVLFLGVGLVLAQSPPQDRAREHPAAPGAVQLYTTGHQPRRRPTDSPLTLSTTRARSNAVR